MWQKWLMWTTAALNQTVLVLAVGLMVTSGAWAADYQTPKTAFGHPDLQGVWTNATITMLERSGQFDGPVLSEEEAQAFEKNNIFAVRRKADAKATDPSQGAPQAGQNVGGYNAFWTDPGDRLVWYGGEYRTSIIVEPEDGKIPYAEAGRQGYARGMERRANFDGPETRPLGERCAVGFGSTGGPPMLPVLYNNHYQIVQTPDYVVILVEMNHDARIIPLAEAAVSNIPQWLGQSVGHWEGDTLVVKTTDFHRDQTLRSATRHRFYIPSSAEVTERFTRVADDRIEYSFTVADDQAYTQPWRGEMPFYKTDKHIFEYACHEGNYALPGILAGARREEREGP